jgi:membrane protein
MKDALGLLKDTVSGWSSDNATRLSAALSYYAIFSIAPILIIVIAIVGLIFGHEAAQGQIAGQLQNWVGGNTASAVQSWVEAAGRSKSSGIWATIIGFAVLLLGATTFFGELKSALNTIWGVTASPGHAISAIVRDRILSFSMVLSIGFLLLVSLIISALLVGLSGWLATLISLPPALWRVLDLLLSLTITTTLFALLFKILPNVILRWKDVIPGAALTALLFTLGKFAIAWYLGTSSAGSSFGAAGSVIIILLWVYYATCILFLGAEFTKVYRHRYGGPVQPDKFGMFAQPMATPGEATAEKGAVENKETVVK